MRQERPRKAWLARTSTPRQRVGASVPAANECVPHVMQIYRLPSTSFYGTEHRPGRFASTIVDSIYHLPRSTTIYRVEGRATTPQPTAHGTTDSTRGARGPGPTLTMRPRGVPTPPRPGASVMHT